MPILIDTYWQSIRNLIFLYIDYINCDSIICVRLKKERKNEMSNLEYY